MRNIAGRLARLLSRLKWNTWAKPPRYEEHLAALRRAPMGFRILREPMDDSGAHPHSYIDFECEFAAAQVKALLPREILDIGSYRQFVAGLAAGHTITSLDVRDRPPRVPGETVLTADAKALPLPDGSFDCVVSLCSIEHFGLGRYGDEFDPSADERAAREMARVLRPGGMLILSTTITRGPPTLAFNAHRIYDVARIRELFGSLVPVEEKYFSLAAGPCEPAHLRDTPGTWDVYCGSFRKPGDRRRSPQDG